MNSSQTVRQSSRRVGGSPRIWLLPPVLLRGIGETLEGAVVLSESPGDLGFCLWQTARDVRLWAEVDPAHRSGLFQGGPPELAVAGDRALRVPLTTVCAQLANPGSADAEVLATACLRIAWRAEERRCLGTAVVFAMVASLAAPSHPGPAYEAGRLSSAWDDQVRAETWLRRAIGLARRARDPRVYCRAAVTLGDVYAARDELTGARSLYNLGLRASRRHGMQQARADAVLGLLRLAITAGDREAIDRLQDLAQRSFGHDHPRRPELILTLARLWIDTGEQQMAREALRRLVPELETDQDRMALSALLARAEVEPGTPTSIAEVWHDVWTMAEARRGARACERALVDLALSGIVLGNVDRVRAAFTQASPLSPRSDSLLQRDYARVEEWLAAQARWRGRA